MLKRIATYRLRGWKEDENRDATVDIEGPELSPVWDNPLICEHLASGMQDAVNRIREKHVLDFAVPWGEIDVQEESGNSLSSSLEVFVFERAHPKSPPKFKTGTLVRSVHGIARVLDVIRDKQATHVYFVRFESHRSDHESDWLALEHELVPLTQHELDYRKSTGQLP